MSEKEGEEISQRKYTEKGFQWQLDQRTKAVRTLISRWNRSSETVSILLSDSKDISVIMEERDRLVSIMNEVRSEGERLRTLVESEESDNALLERLDAIETEHHALLISVGNTLCDLREDKVESASVASNSSRKSSKSHHSVFSKGSLKTHTSASSDRSGLAAKAAALKVKLKYLDAEAKAKLEFERIKMQKGLDLVQVRVWSGGAMVLGKLPVPGRPTIWITVGQGSTALAVGAGGGCLDIFTLICPFSFLSPSLWETT